MRSHIRKELDSPCPAERVVISALTVLVLTMQNLEEEGSDFLYDDYNPLSSNVLEATLTKEEMRLLL